MTTSDAVIVTVGTTVVGSTVVGATVVGATVVGATVVGATVVGATVVGAAVALADALAVAVADLEAVAVAFVVVVVFAAGVVGTVPDVDTVGVELTSGPTVAPVPVVGGVSSALRIGDSPVPARFVDPPITLGLELPLALAWTPAGDSIGSAVGAGQLAALQAMNPPTELVWDALVPYQQRSVMAPSTPVPITRFRTECGR